jgi:membrane protein DedA with SNARE-associated domain/rhodanese-related sulfurtransferase
MHSWTGAIALHGYAILLGAIFLEAIGLPIPAALALLIAGAASARGLLQLSYVLGGSVAAMLAADTLMYGLGRYTGWWLLGALCRISLNPESCILRSADSFYRRGRALLVISKFIPGVGTMAAPLAGSMNMRVAEFLPLDLAGTLLYIGAYLGVGYLFSNALATITRGYEAASQVLGWAVIALIAAYVVLQLWWWLKERRLPRVKFAEPAEAAHALQSGAHIYDVRSHGYFDPRAVRIRGSRRLEPHALNQSRAQLPEDQPVYLYCTCARQATSARVARELRMSQDGKRARIAVIRGGLRAWTRAGYAVEPVPPDDMQTLPAFR